MAHRNQNEIQRVLAGDADYDDLDQAAERANRDGQVPERLAHLDLAPEFAQAGRGWSEADPQGRVSLGCNDRARSLALLELSTLGWR